MLRKRLHEYVARALCSFAPGVPLIGGGGGSVGYQLTRSLRFRASASAYLNRTPAGAGNRRKWTYSVWVKRGTIGGANQQELLSAYSGDADTAYLTVKFNTDDTLYIDGFATPWRRTTQVFRDPAAWYHIVLAWDNDNATAGNRVLLYVNGVQITAFGTSNNPATATDYALNQAAAHNIGRNARNANAFFDGEMAQPILVDGQALTPSSFGQTDATTGVWVPKQFSAAYGTNGFVLPFTDTSSTSNLVKDASGNGNNWTPNNISLTAGVTYDSMLDVPYCVGQAGGTQPNGNYAVPNTLDKSVAGAGTSVVDGGLAWSASTSTNRVRSSVPYPASGKFYCEIVNDTATTASIGCATGVCNDSISLTAGAGSAGEWIAYQSAGGNLQGNGVNQGSIGAVSANTVNQVAADATNGKVWLGRNNVWFDSAGGTTGNPSTGANPTFTTTVAGLFAMGFVNTTGAVVKLSFNHGQQPWTYTPPTGFAGLCAPNLPTPTIKKGNAHFDVNTRAGTGSAFNVTGKNFQPDIVISKSRSLRSWMWANSVRGVGKYLSSDSTGAETTDAQAVTAFNSDGFSGGTSAILNTNAENFVDFLFKGGGAAATNNSGSITSQVSVNAAAGISVGTFAGTGANGTVGHGLGVAPAMVITRNTAIASAWRVWHKGLTAGNELYFDVSAQTAWGTDFTAAPNSSVISFGSNNGVNGSGQVSEFIAFAEVPGFSKSGSHTGNASTDGPFNYCGFRPRFLLLKKSGAASTSLGWIVVDTARDSGNITLNSNVWADGNNAESANYGIDLLSNGFKLRSSGTNENAATGFIWQAFAETPFNYATAR